MKARIRIELPPGVEDTPDVRARLADAVRAGCWCGEHLEKSGAAPARKLPHRAPQDAVERATQLYERQMRAMLDEIAAVLAE